jgi:hypothetical protein
MFAAQLADDEDDIDVPAPKRIKSEPSVAGKENTDLTGDLEEPKTNGVLNSGRNPRSTKKTAQ